MLGAVGGLVAAFVLTGALAASAAPKSGSSAKVGGIFKVGWEDSFGVTDNFDPTGEYLGEAFGIFSDLEVRTLVGYNHVAGAAGNKLVPDIATAVPKPTDGGKTYTYHLKSGVMFSPPVSRDVTSKDVLFAMERLADPKDGGEYPFYYTVIKGWNAYAAACASKAGCATKTISGISTPNASTIVFHLTAPTGDFNYRMSMPATGPQPKEVAGCFEGFPQAYGDDLIATGPYMIEGIDKIDISSCAKIVSPKGKPLEPASGYDGTTTLTLVRNPNYNPKTDTLAARQNLPDEFQFLVDSNADDILNKVSAGTLDDEISSIPSQTLEKYATTSSLKKYLHSDSGDRTWYLTMNITQPPFDDIHVRRAMNWIMDKAALVQAWGGPTIGKVANHIVPDTLFNNQLAEYAPYRTPGDHGSLTKAEAAMKGSKYDTSGNGQCDAAACKNVLLLADAREVDTKMLPVITADAAKIGITFKVTTIKGAYPTIQTPSKNIPIAERPGWGKDYADALTFFTPLFDGRTIIPSGNTNYSLVGVTQATCTKLKIGGDCAPYDAATGVGVPSVNTQLDKCAALTGQPRLSCYESLDKTLMTNVVPWVPYLWSYATHISSSNVTKWEFDQFSGGIAYAHVAVKS
jgi:peptide/nickel transport system substrate-binding protein